jgi:hypothetical protein
VLKYAQIVPKSVNGMITTIAFNAQKPAGIVKRAAEII